MSPSPALPDCTDAATDEDGLLSRVMTAPPVDTTYVAGLWHRDRFTLQGLRNEARVLGKALLTRQAATGATSKFLIIGRARSGTTLLTDLLNSHAEVQCDREMLHYRVLAPASYLDRLAAKSDHRAYGAKLLSYQMIQVQRFRDPQGFLAELIGRGFRLIHLQRDTFAQTLSLYMAQNSGRYHSIQTRDAPQQARTATIDPDDFARRLEWSDLLLRYEKWCLADIPHLQISYERDLTGEQNQADAAHRIFDWIGVPDAPVSSALRKVLPGDPTAAIANYDVVADTIRARGLGHLLPDAPTAAP